MLNPLQQLRRQLRKNARRLDRLQKAMPGGPTDRLATYQAYPCRLLVDAGCTPDAWQARLMRSECRRVLMLTCRQAGKSTTAGFLALRESLLHDSNTILVVCPSQRQSAELVLRVRNAVNHLNGTVEVDGESALQIRLSNRSRIIALPASEGGIRGFTAGMVILDEAARIPDSLVAAVRPMLGTTGGKLVCLSTAFAKSGFFYEQWTGPEAWDRVKVTADQNPRLTPEFLAEERRALGPRWYEMEYFCVFGDDMAAVFSTDDIRAARSPTLLPLFPNESPALPVVADSSVPPLKPLFPT